MSGVVWLDGSFLPPAEAQIPALSRAALYGEGLFETLRIYGGRPFGLDEHRDRMTASARELGIPLPGALGSVEGLVPDLVARNGMPESVLRLSVLAGEGEGAHLLLSLRPLPAGLEQEQSRGISVATVRAGSLPLAAHKTTSYLRYLVGGRVAGTRETILVDDDGLVLEGCRSNVFAVLGDQLVTPPANGRILAGITRRIVLELAGAAGLVARERPLRLEELAGARAVAVTNSVVEILPIRTLDVSPVGGGRPDAVIGRIAGLYRALVREKPTS